MDGQKFDIATRSRASHLGTPVPVRIKFEDRSEMLRIKFIAAILVLAAPMVVRAADTAIDPANSVITIHVFKTGLFSAFGHDHEIAAPVESGSFSEQPPSVSLMVDARKLKVMDKDVSEKD